MHTRLAYLLEVKVLELELLPIFPSQLRLARQLESASGVSFGNQKRKVAEWERE